MNNKIRTFKNRKSIRLKGYDYSRSGNYFITINTYKNKYLFGEVKNGEMVLNKIGEIIEKDLLELNKKYQNIRCHEYIVMPNHMHFIIEIMEDNKNEIKSWRTKGWENPIRADSVGAGSSRPDDSHNPDASHNPPKDINLGNIIGFYKYLTTKNYNNFIENKNEKYHKIWHKSYYDHIVRNQYDFNRISKYIKNNPKKWSSAGMGSSHPEDSIK